LLGARASPPEPFFCGPGLDRADQLRAQPERLAELCRSAEARQLVWRDGFPAIGQDGALEWRQPDAPDLFLGLEDNVPCYSAFQTEIGEPKAAFSALGLLGDRDAPLYAAALSLARWHARHRFCANCGSPSEAVRGGWSRSCAACAAEHFPRVDPVVIMLAEHEGSVLLGRQPHYPPGRYSALAGFVEVGESIENAVARELKEEAGIEVAAVSYLCSQPWPFPSSLMIGCTAPAADGRLTIDTTELDDARWFTRSEVEAAVSGADDAAFQAPPKWAIARTLLERWLAA
jgi:NAD+ diphosphatase